MAGADFKEIESKMHKCVDAARGDFAAIRTGRASPALLDRRGLRSARAAQAGRRSIGPGFAHAADHGLGQRRRFRDSKGN